MAFSHTLTRTLLTDAGTLTATTVKSGEAEVNATIAVPDPSTNKHVVIVLRKDGITSLFLLASKDMSVYTNNPSGSNPDNTLVLKANIPRIWTTSEGTDIGNPIVTADVTALYITLTGSGDATLEIRAVQDATP